MFKFSKVDIVLLSISCLGTTAMVLNIYTATSFQRPLQTPEIGQIQNIKNIVKIKPKGSFDWQNLSVINKNIIYESDYIFSGSDSSANINLKNGDQIKLLPNSLIYLSQESEGSFNLIVYDGSANYKSKETDQIQEIKQSEKIVITNNSKTLKTKKAPVKSEIVKMKNQSTKIVLSDKVVDKIQKIAEQKPEPPPITPIEPIPTPIVEEKIPEMPKVIVEEKPPAPPKILPKKVRKIAPRAVAEPKMYFTAVRPVKSEITLPNAVERYKGKIPVLKVNWDRAESDLSYKVSFFNKKDPNTPLHIIETEKNSLDLSWKKTGTYLVLVEKKIQSIDRPPASVSESDSSEFSKPDLKIETPLRLEFPIENQLILAQKKYPLFLKWRKSPQYTDYILRISTDSEFKNDTKEVFITKEKFSDFKFNITSLKDGTWYWKMKGISPVSESEWSRPKKFKLVFNSK